MMSKCGGSMLITKSGQSNSAAGNRWHRTRGAGSEGESCDTTVGSRSLV